MLTNRFYNPTDPLWEALEKPEARGENNKTLLLLKAYDAIEKARQALIGSTRAKIGDIACCIQLLLIAADAALKEIITIIAEATNTNIDEVLKKHTSYYIDDTTEDNNMLVDEIVQVNEEKKLVKIVMDCTQHCNICDQLEPILTSRQHDIAVCIKIGEALITATAKIKRTPTLCVHGRDAPYMLDYEKIPKTRRNTIHHNSITHKNNRPRPKRHRNSMHHKKRRKDNHHTKRRPSRNKQPSPTTRITTIRPANNN